MLAVGLGLNECSMRPVHAVDLIEDGDNGEKPAMKQQRRLSRAKTTLLVVEPQEAAVANSSKAPGSNNKIKVRKSDDPALETTFYGGGIPGTALDSERVELPEFTGVREGGYQVDIALFIVCFVRSSWHVLYVLL